MNFRFFRRPGTVVLLDDDPDYLEMLGMVLPPTWHLRMFLRPAQCIRYIHREPRRWETDEWNQQLMVDQWRQGKALIPQILGYWSQATERYGLTHVCVVDFSMPGMDGLQVLSELRDLPGARVLLTGQADERVAVGAFNRGLIDQYIPKQASNISLRLIETLEQLADRPHDRHDLVWRATLQPTQLGLLREEGVQDALRSFAQRQWVEHVVIGDPFGVLGMDAAGHVSWLQLEAREGLPAMAEVAALEGVDDTLLAEIRCGRRLASPELGQALGLEASCEPAPAFPLGESGDLLGALFPLPARILPSPMPCYAEWLGRQGPRQIAD